MISSQSPKLLDEGLPTGVTVEQALVALTAIPRRIVPSGPRRDDEILG